MSVICSYFFILFFYTYCAGKWSVTHGWYWKQEKYTLFAVERGDQHGDGTGSDHQICLSLENENALPSKHTITHSHFQSLVTAWKGLVWGGWRQMLGLLALFVLHFEHLLQWCLWRQISSLCLRRHFKANLTFGHSALSHQWCLSNLAGPQQEINMRLCVSKALLYYHIQQLGHSRGLVSCLVSFERCLQLLGTDSLLQTSWNQLWTRSVWVKYLVHIWSSSTVHFFSGKQPELPRLHLIVFIICLREYDTASCHHGCHWWALKIWERWSKRLFS